MNREIVEFLRDRERIPAEVPDAEVWQYARERHPQLVREAEGEPAKEPEKPAERGAVEVAPGQDSVRAQGRVEAALKDLRDALSPLIGPSERQKPPGTDYKPAGDKIEREGLVPALRSVPYNVMGQQSKVAVAVAEDVADLPANLAGTSEPGQSTGRLLEPGQRDEPSPVAQRIEDSGLAGKISGHAGQGLAGIGPYLGAAGGLAAAGAPAAVAASLPLAFDEEGKPQFVKAALMAALPAVFKAGEKGVAAALGRGKVPEEGGVILEVLRTPAGEQMLKGQVVQKFPGGVTLTSDAVRQGLEKSGGAALSAAYLTAGQLAEMWPELKELPEETQKEMVLDLAAQNIGMSLMGLGHRQPLSRTLENMAPGLLAKIRAATGRRAGPGMDWSRGSESQGGEFVGPDAPVDLGAVVKARPQPKVETEMFTGGGRKPMPKDQATTVLPVKTSKDEETPFKVTADGIILGKETTVIGQRGQKLRAIYALIPDGQGVNSVGLDWTTPTNYELQNTRDYQKPNEREKLVDGANNFVPALVINNTPDASGGPSIYVARDIEALMELKSQNGPISASGGNARHWIIDALTTKQRQDYAEEFNRNHEIYGLPQVSSLNYRLGRILIDHDTSTPDRRALAQETVDILNPSQSLRETTAAMARNDAGKLTPELLAEIRPDSPPGAKADWLRKLFRLEIIDRNTRRAILESPSETDDYATRLLIRAAYQNSALDEQRFMQSAPATLRGLTDLAAPLMLEMRRAGPAALPVVETVNGLMTRLYARHAAKPKERLRQALQTVASQEEFNGGKEFAAARLLGQVLEKGIEETQKGEKTSLDGKATLENWETTLDGLRRMLRENHDNPGAELLGQPPDFWATLEQWFKYHLGPKASLAGAEPTDPLMRMQEEPAQYRASAEEWKRTNAALTKLRQTAEQRPLTAAEHKELARLELALGQQFMDFWEKQTGHDAAAKAERERRELEAKAKARLVADPVATQGGLFAEPGQMALFDKGKDLGDSAGNEGEATAEERAQLEARRAAYQLARGDTGTPMLSGWEQAVSGRADRGGANALPGEPAKSGATILAEIAGHDLLTHGYHNVVGQAVRDPRDAALVYGRILRNNKFEVHSWVPVKFGKVAGPMLSYTLGLPDMVQPLGGQTQQEKLDFHSTLYDLVKTTEATQIDSVHNHPSGDPAGSAADLRAARGMAKMLAEGSWVDENGGEYAGVAKTDPPTERSAWVPPMPRWVLFRMVVIDHGKATVIYVQDGQVIEKSVDLNLAGPDPLHQPAPGADPRAAAQFEKLADSGYKAAEIARAVFDGQDYGFLALDTRLKVRGFFTLPAGTTAAEAAKEIRRVAWGMGARRVTGYYGGGHPDAAAGMLTELIKQGVILDGIVDAGGVASSLRDIVPGKRNDNTYFGESEKAKARAELALREAVENYQASKQPTHETAALVWEKGPDTPGVYAKGLKPGAAKAPESVRVALGGMEHVKPLEMPEIVRLAKLLLGETPLLKRLPQALGLFRPAGRGRIVLRPDIFQDYEDAAKTLAHEVGHLIDYLPQYLMERGNLFGRLASLREFLKTTFPLKASTPASEILTKEDRTRLRREAEKEVGPRPANDNKPDLVAWRQEVSRIYREKVEAEIERRGLAKLDEVRQELESLSDYWKPIPEGAPQSYIDYRLSAVELYADALSVLMNNPALLAERAPIFWGMFFEYLDRKPAVKDNLFALWDLVNKGKIPTIEQRRADVRAGFAKGEEILKEKAEERARRRWDFRAIKTELMTALVDANWPLVELANAAERAGKVIPWHQDPRLALEEAALAENRVARWLERMTDQVVKPLYEADLDTATLGEYLMLRRDLADRAGLANPYGIGQNPARQQLLQLRLSLGMNRATVLDLAANRFHELVDEVVRDGVEAGSYNRETYETILAPNKYRYATYAVLDYLSEHIPAGIKRQIGTLKEIANPFTATVLKMVTLHNLNAIQRAKRSAVSFLAENFPAEIEVAPKVWNGARWEPRRAPEGKGLLMLLQDGKPLWFYVEPGIAEMFERQGPAILEQTMAPLRALFSTVFYPVFITYNPGFHAVNVRRDWSRTRRNLGAGRKELAKAYWRAVKPAARRLLGHPDPVIREMVANLALGLPDTDMVRGGDLKNPEDYLLELLQRYRIIPPPPEGRLAAWGRKMAWLRFLGNLGETLPKVASYQLLRARGMEPREAAAQVRNYVGTPNVRKKGRLVHIPRAVVPFWNVFVQGWMADGRLMTNPRTRGGWWMRWAMRDGAWAVLQGMAAAGLLGATLKALFDGISEYMKTNYAVLPLGIEPGGEMGGRTRFISVPRDETSRVVSGITYNAVKLLTGEPTAFPRMLDFAGGQVPGVNPVLQLAGAWGEYARGRNPEDPFRNQPVVPRTEWEAGGWHAAKPMFLWSYNQTGLQDFWRLSDVINDTDSKLKVALAFAPGVNRYVRVSDYGKREMQEELNAEDAQQRAVQRLELPAEVRSLLSEYYLLSRNKHRTPEQDARYARLKIWKRETYAPLDDALEAARAMDMKDQSRRIRERMGESAREFKKRNR